MKRLTFALASKPQATYGLSAGDLVSSAVLVSWSPTAWPCMS
jgi:hypothetical protein